MLVESDSTEPKKYAVLAQPIFCCKENKVLAVVVYDFYGHEKLRDFINKGKIDGSNDIDMNNNCIRAIVREAESCTKSIATFLRLGE